MLLLKQMKSEKVAWGWFGKFKISEVLNTKRLFCQTLYFLNRAVRKAVSQKHSLLDIHYFLLEERTCLEPHISVSADLPKHEVRSWNTKLRGQHSQSLMESSPSLSRQGVRDPQGPKQMLPGGSCCTGVGQLCNCAQLS